MTDTSPPSSTSSSTPPGSGMNDAVSYQIPGKKGKGCFFYGCLTLIIVAVLSILAVYFAIRGFVHSVTDSTPSVFPTVEISSERSQELKTRLQDFAEAVKKGEPGVELRLQGDELNEAIAVVPQLEKLRDRARLAIVGDRLEGKVSMNLSAFGFSDRYVNGEASIGVRISQGTLSINLLSLSTTGWTMPPEMIDAIRQKNIAEEVMKDPDNKKTLSKIATLEIKDGVLVIKTQ